MAEVVLMPKLSDTMTEGVVAEWHKKVGDKVESGDLLAEIESDKATMEFESFYDGTLLHIAIDEGVAANVDTMLCIIGEENEDISSLVGLKNDDELNLDFSKIGKEKFFYDVIYNPKETSFLRKGKKLGHKTENGKKMFIIVVDYFCPGSKKFNFWVFF